MYNRKMLSFKLGNGYQLGKETNVYLNQVILNPNDIIFIKEYEMKFPDTNL